MGECATCEYVRIIIGIARHPVETSQERGQQCPCRCDTRHRSRYAGRKSEKASLSWNMCILCLQVKPFPEVVPLDIYAGRGALRGTGNHGVDCALNMGCWHRCEACG